MWGCALQERRLGHGERGCAGQVSGHRVGKFECSQVQCFSAGSALACCILYLQGSRFAAVAGVENGFIVCLEDVCFDWGLGRLSNWAGHSGKEECAGSMFCLQNFSYLNESGASLKCLCSPFSYQCLWQSVTKALQGK